MSTPYSTPSFTASYQVGQIDAQTPIPQSPTALWLHVTYEQEAYQNGSVGYVPAPLDYQDPNLPNTFYLVSNGDAKFVDGNLCRFTNVYSNLPPSRNEFESYQFTFPAILNFTTGGFIRNNITAVGKSRVAYSYYHGTTPTASISIVTQFFPVTFFGGVSTFQLTYVSGEGTVPTAGEYYNMTVAQTEICVEATSFKRWAGNFYEIRTRYMPAF